MAPRGDWLGLWVDTRWLPPADDGADLVDACRESGVVESLTKKLSGLPVGLTARQDRPSVPRLGGDGTKRRVRLNILAESLLVDLHCR